MSNMSSDKEVYYTRYDTPKLENRLHKAAFNGKLEKVKRLIAEGINIYETTKLNESILFISIARDHEAIANVFIDIYENDLKAIEEFFLVRNVQNYFWLKESILIAYGDTHIQAVKNLTHNIHVKDPFKMIAEKKSGLIILLKTTNTAKPEVLWLTQQSVGDDLKLAEIIGLIYSGGILHVARKEHWNRSLLDVAVFRNFPELHSRLLSAYGIPYLTNTEYLSNFCHLCRNVSDNRVNYYQQLVTRLNKFKIEDVLENDWSILRTPLYMDEFDIFEYFLDVIAKLRMQKFNETKSEALKYVIDNQFEHSTNIIQCLTSCDRVDMAIECLKYDPELLTTAGSCEITLFTFIRNQKPNAIITGYIVDHFHEIQQKELEEKTVKRLIKAGWVDAIRILYEKFPATKDILFKNPEKGLKILLQGIDECRYAITNFLVEAHRDQLTSPKDIIQLIHSCAYVNRSHDVLITLLSLPNANPALICEDQYYKSPLYIALKFGHLQNYYSLIKLTNPSDIMGIKEADGDNLLTVAIWYKQPVIDEEPFVYIPESRETLEIIDSSDDEDAVVQKTDYNKKANNPPNLYPERIIPNEFYRQQQEEYNAIFEYFISIGIDYKNVNKTGENLIHIAVKHDNLHILNRLLDLGVNPNAMDEKGNKPVHLVKSVAVFQVLFDQLSKDILTEANVDGELPLHTFVKDVNSKTADLLLNMIQSGADVNATDKLGNTALHFVKNVEFAEILLANGADINAVDTLGKTPIHAQLSQTQNTNIFKLMLKQRNLNLLITDKSGVSILAAMVLLNDDDFNEIIPVLEERQSMLNELFRVNCNSVDHYGTPVFNSSCYYNSYCAKRMLELAELDINSFPPEHSAIPAGVYAQDKSILPKIIELIRDVNVHTISASGFECTALQFALGERRLLRVGDIDDIKLLLKFGAKPELKDVSGVMQLRELYNENVYMPIVATLIKAGADYRVKDENGRQPLEETVWKCLYEFE